MSAVLTSEGRIGHLRTQENSTLAECLAEGFGLTPSDGRRLLSIGAVYVDRERVNADQPLAPGQYVRAHLFPRRFPVEGIDWRAAIAHEAPDFIVVDKPAGVPTHATLDNTVENVLHLLGVAIGRPLLITQRLDTAVGGLMVFAKTRKFQRRFNALLAERQVQKRYRALVSTPPGLGRHVHYMQPAARTPKTVSAESHPEWLQCALRVTAIEPFEIAFDVAIDLETGRTHQIRAQLAALGSPIAGDTLYGSQQPYPWSGIALFSRSIAFADWTFNADPPWRRA